MQQQFSEAGQNILPFQGEVNFYPCFFSVAEADQYLNNLLHEVQWRQQPIKIFGKEIMQPRLTAWFSTEGKSYTYSGITMLPLEWPNTLTIIKEKIETVSPVKFNSVLLNLYRDGKDSMGWHRDNEKELGINPVIGSVSLGAARTFQMRHYKDKSKLRSIDLTHGSLLLMAGETQHYWEHQIPKTNKMKGKRINLTFRMIP